MDILLETVTRDYQHTHDLLPNTSNINNNNNSNNNDDDDDDSGKIVITIMIVITTTITTVKFPKIFNSHTEPFLCPSNLFGRQRFDYFLGYGYNSFMGQIT